jgi:hypothetical protein
MSASLRTLDDTYLTCRSLKHAWEVWSFRKLDPEDEDRWGARIRAKHHGTPIKRVLTCLRCGTERIDMFVRRTPSQRDMGTYLPFERVSSFYRYPDGYVLEGDRPAFIDYAVEQFRRGT